MVEKLMRCAKGCKYYWSKDPVSCIFSGVVDSKVKLGSFCKYSLTEAYTLRANSFDSKLQEFSYHSAKESGLEQGVIGLE
jgi:hypothetical protein